MFTKCCWLITGSSLKTANAPKTMMRNRLLSRVRGFIFRLPLWFALILVAVPAVFVVVNQRGGLPCFCPMHIGFDVFGADEFEQVVKFVGLHGQIAVVGGKAVAAPYCVSGCRLCLSIMRQPENSLNHRNSNMYALALALPNTFSGCLCLQAVVHHNARSK